MLDGGSTSGNGSFLFPFPLVIAWLAPWRFSFGARRLGCAVAAHIGGCWPTKSRCFRCGAPRNSAPRTLVLAFPRRESHHPARAPKPTPAPVNPTFRQPRVILPKRGGAPSCFLCSLSTADVPLPQLGPDGDRHAASKFGAL